MKIRSIDKNVKELLSSQYYRIPRFQRPYSWDRDNINDFWNDIIADRFHEEDYFIGSIVVYQDKNEYLGIVDGQQRLTTIILFLCAIRNIFEFEHFNLLALGTQSIVEKTNSYYLKQFVLSTESSYPYFQEKILKFGVPTIDVEVGPEEDNIQNAFNLIQSLIKDTIKSVKENPSIGEERKKQEIENKLIEIRERVLSLKLIFIGLEDEDDAYIIFETLNTRGKDLTISDLLRNFFAKNIRPTNADIDTAKIQWTKIQKIINDSSSEIDIDAYIHHYWLSKYSYLPSKLLFKTIKKQIKGNDVQIFLNELEINSEYYRQIHETNFIKWLPTEKTSRESLDALQLFRVKQQTPLVLSIIRSYRNGTLKIKQVEHFLQAVENFHFIFTAITSQRSSGGISQMYVNAAINLEKALNCNPFGITGVSSAWPASSGARRNRSNMAKKRRLLSVTTIPKFS